MTRDHTQPKTVRRPSGYRTPIGMLIRASFLELLDPILSGPGRFFEPVIFGNSCMKATQRSLYARDPLVCLTVEPMSETHIDFPAA